MPSHWAIGLPLIFGTLVGMAVLTKSRSHHYHSTTPPPELDALAGHGSLRRKKSKEEHLEEMRRRVETRDDYEMKPVV
jgi:hypothetical protein